MAQAFPPEEFSEFYRRHVQAVYRVCFTYMKNPQDAEDCTEDVFVKVLTGAPRFENERHRQAWLTVTAMNLCKDRLRSWWYKKTEGLAGSEDRLTAEMPQPDRTLEAVKALPARYKDVVWLYYYEGYKTEEIAQLLGRRPSTVRNQLRDAREKLRSILGEETL